MDTPLKQGRGMMPGLMVSVIVAAAAVFLSEHYGAPATLFALLLGMALNFLADDNKMAAGIQFASRTLLRMGVALMGLRISFGEIASIGLLPVISVVGLVAMTIAAGWLLSRWLGLDRMLGLLTGSAVAICGASAALAVSAVLPKNEANERNTLFTVVAVTALSTVAMIVYPILFGKLGLDLHVQGVLIGATIHDVAQVMGAAFAVSDDAGETATIIKLFRVALLPVVVVVLALSMGSRGQQKPSEILPLFVVAFVVLVALNSFGLAPAIMRDFGTEASRWLLITAIAALGIKTSLQAMLALGGRHIWLVCAETLLLLGGAISCAVFGLL